MPFGLLFSLWGCKDPKPTDTSQEKIEESAPVFSADRQISLTQTSSNWLQPDDNIINTYGGAGVSFIDVNHDGHTDIVLARRDGIHIYTNDTVGGLIQTETIELDTVMPVVVSGINPIDSSKSEFYVATVFGLDQWLVDDKPPQPIEGTPNFSGGGSFYDLSNDQQLEIAVAGYVNDNSPAFNQGFNSNNPIDGDTNVLLSTNADSPPSLSTDWQLPQLPLEPYTFSLLWLPFNNDNDWDLLAINDFGMLSLPHTLFWNDGDALQWEEEHLGLAVPMFGMGVAPADVNADQIPDLLITNIGNPVVLLSDSGGWYDVATSWGLGLQSDQSTCWGADWHDVNNDGHLDVWVGCGPLPVHEDDTTPNYPDQPDSLFIWTEEGYVDVAKDWGVSGADNTRAGGFVDLNNDGCWELVRVPLDGPTQIFTGSCNPTNNWIDISLYQNGLPAIGSTVQVVTEETTRTEWIVGGGTSFATFQSFTAHFGLGSSNKVDIVVTWPDGSQDEYEAVETNQHLSLQR